jgi:phosphoribosylaminoimidazole-succinocarboxamide synthase
MNQDNVLLKPTFPGWAESPGQGGDISGVGENLLIVATDRISAFDYILQTGIPQKVEC